MPDYLHALPAGYRLDEYELVRVLGSGGFGITYLGYDHHLDKAVAIKEYLPNDLAVRADNHSVLPKSSQDKADYEWGLARFLNEAQTLARFDHRHIIKVYRFFRAHGTGYIVMEYAEGDTLSKVLQRKGTLTETELQALLFPILDGLAVVHEADVLHRDIKPGNIVIRDDGSPVLIDFGSARQAVAGKSRSVTAIVTPGYAPIEQYSAKGHQGAWTDIYALGAVCYRCLTGELPDDATERLRDDPLVPAVQHCKGKASTALLNAIDRSLKVDEGERPQSVAAWREMLLNKTVASAYHQIEETAKPATRPPSISSPEAKVGWLKPLLVGVAVWVICLLLVFLAQEQAAIQQQAVKRERIRQEQAAIQQEQAVKREQRIRQEKLSNVEMFEQYIVEQAVKRKQRILQEKLSNVEMFDQYIVEQAVNEHWNAFTAELRTGDLVGAAASLFQIRQLSPNAPGLSDGERLLAEAQVAALAKAIEMVSIPGGTFRMGDLSGEGYSNEQPVRRVTVPAFRLGKYEVTFAQWDACVADGGCNGYTPLVGWGRGNRPVGNVSWNDAQSFIDWLNGKTGGNYRLPTEAEWEYAARAGTTTKYSWGDDIGSNRANCDDDVCGDSYEYSAPVGSFPANPWGLHDMHGNVWEWVQDCYNDSYKGAPTDGSAWMSGNCGERVLRGSSWFGDARFLHSAFRFKGAAASQFHFDIGFRLAQDK